MTLAYCLSYRNAIKKKWQMECKQEKNEEKNREQEFININLQQCFKSDSTSNTNPYAASISALIVAAFFCIIQAYFSFATFTHNLI